MTALVLMVELHRQGVRLEARGNRLAVNAPKGILTLKVHQTLLEHKMEILRRLTSGGISLKDVEAVFPGCEVIR